MHDAEGEHQPLAHADPPPSPPTSPPPSAPSPPSQPIQHSIGLPPLPNQSPKYINHRSSPLPLNSSSPNQSPKDMKHNPSPLSLNSPLPNQSPKYMNHRPTQLALNSPTNSPLLQSPNNQKHPPIYHAFPSPNSPQRTMFHATPPQSPNPPVASPLMPHHRPILPHPPPLQWMPSMQPSQHAPPHPYFQHMVSSSSSAYYQYAPAPFPYSHSPHQQNILMVPTISRNWSTGLFDCFSDIKNCILTLWCPCVTFGQVSEILTEGHIKCWESTFVFTGLFCFSMLFSFSNRTKLRKKFSVEGDLCSDLFTSLFCQCCVLCQMYRQLDRMGYKVALGWEANKEYEHQRVTQASFQVPPCVDPRMLR